MSTTVFKRFGKNTDGRDFCVGDIHGAYTSVIERMKQVNFNPARDRLFTLGDLIDRGVGSVRVLKFLAQPYVYAIRGNHDHAFASFSVDELRVLGEMNWNGLWWVKDVSDATLREIQRVFLELPFAMEVETDRGSVGLVHADVPQGMTWPTFVARLQAGDEQTLHTALWGRDRLRRGDDMGVEGIDRMFVGHSIQANGPQRLANVYYIDSGAIFRELGEMDGYLTIANLACASQAIAPPKGGTWQERGVFPIAASGPFGRYARSVLGA